MKYKFFVVFQDNNVFDLEFPAARWETCNDKLIVDAGSKRYVFMLETVRYWRAEEVA